jgi:hypothetical protein
VVVLLLLILLLLLLLVLLVLLSCRCWCVAAGLDQYGPSPAGVWRQGLINTGLHLLLGPIKEIALDILRLGRAVRRWLIVADG